MFTRISARSLTAAAPKNVGSDYQEKVEMSNVYCYCECIKKRIKAFDIVHTVHTRSF